VAFSILSVFFVNDHRFVLVRGVWRYQKVNPNSYTSIEEEQSTQWPKEKVQKDKQRSTKHTYKTKDRVTRTPLKSGGELRCSGRVISSCSTSGLSKYIPIRIFRGLLLTRKLLNQAFLLVKLKSSLRKCCGRHHDLVDRYNSC
jgi:hypothetical protein